MNCAFDKNRFCCALKEKKCEGCKFRKTPEELEAGRKKAEARLKTLPMKEQVRIQEKYKIRLEGGTDDEQREAD